MKKIIVALLFVALGVWGCDTTTGCLGDFQTAAHATQTETVSSGSVGTLGIYKQVVQTATAANEIGCVEVTGWDYVCVSVDISGTINVDIDGATATTIATNELTFGIALFENATADFGHCVAIYTNALNVTGQDVATVPYVCYDIDSCTTCTLSATWYLFSKRQF